MSDHSFLIRQNQALRDEIDTLHEYVKQLECALVPQVALPRHWNIRGLEEKFFCAIRASGPTYLSAERAMLALYRMSDDLPESRVLYVMIAHIRRKLRRAGCPIVIEGIRERGWRLSPKSCAIFDASLACDQARWPRPISIAAKSIRGISSHAS